MVVCNALGYASRAECCSFNECKRVLSYGGIGKGSFRGYHTGTVKGFVVWGDLACR